MIRARKYRLYPTVAQEAQLLAWMEVCRRLWNYSLLDREQAWENCKQELAENPDGDATAIKKKWRISYFDQCVQLTKSREQHPELRAVPTAFARGTLKNLDLAFQSFFRRCKSGEEPGHPKPKRYPPNLITRDAGGSERWRGGKVNMPSVGLINARPKLPPDLDVKMLSVRSVAGKWYASLAGDNGIPAPPTLEPVRCIGIDVGCSSLITTSEGNEVKPPRYYREAQAKRTKLARQVAKKRKGSENRKKAALKLARAEHDVANARETFLHTLSRRLVDDYDLIAVEDRIAADLLQKDAGGGQQEKGLHKSIADAGWGDLVRMLGYKCEELGKQLVAVPARGTTQTCSQCGAIVPKRLWDRVHDCPECGLIIGRDVNAACEILKRGLQQIGGCPADFMPVEGRERCQV
jgi:putative transposase